VSPPAPLTVGVTLRLWVLYLLSHEKKTESPEKKPRAPKKKNSRKKIPKYPGMPQPQLFSRRQPMKDPEIQENRKNTVFSKKIPKTNQKSL